MKVEGNTLPGFTLGQDTSFEVDITDEGITIADPVKPEKEEEVEEDDKEGFDYETYLAELDEVKEEEDEDEGTVETVEDTEEEGTEVNLFSEFAARLRDADILDLNDEDLSTITDEESLVTGLNKQITNIVDTTLRDLDSRSNGAITHFINGGTVEDFTKSFNKSSILSYSEDDIQNDVNIQRKIAEEYINRTSSKMSKKMKQASVDNLVDIQGEDAILEIYQELKELENSDKEAIALENKRKQEQLSKQKEEFNQTLYNNTLAMDEFVPGRKWDKKMKEKVFQNITPTLEKVNSNLAKYAPTLSALDSLGLLDGDFSKVIKEIETKRTSSFAEVLKQTNPKKFTNNQIKDDRQNNIRSIAKASLKRIK